MTFSTALFRDKLPLQCFHVHFSYTKMISRLLSFIIKCVTHFNFKQALSCAILECFNSDSVKLYKCKYKKRLQYKLHPLIRLGI